MDKAKMEAVMKAAAELSYEEWLVVADSITKAFEEAEHSKRSELRLGDIDRIWFYLKMFNSNFLRKDG